jgi:hypothetical protein
VVTPLSHQIELDVPGLLKMCRREQQCLQKHNIRTPFYRDAASKGVVFTDALAAVIISPVSDELRAALAAVAPEPNEALAVRMDNQTDPRDKKFRVAGYTTTTESLVAWCQKDIATCPRCEGTGECVPMRRDATGTPEEEDAFCVHYGWVGTARIDRRRLHNILRLLQVKSAVPCRLLGLEDVRSYDRDNNLIHVVLPGVRIVLMGLKDVHDAETTFQQDAVFTAPTYREGR